MFWTVARHSTVIRLRDFPWALYKQTKAIPLSSIDDYGFYVGEGSLWSVHYVVVCLAMLLRMLKAVENVNRLIVI